MRSKTGINLQELGKELGISVEGLRSHETRRRFPKQDRYTFIVMLLNNLEETAEKDDSEQYPTNKKEPKSVSLRLCGNAEYKDVITALLGSFLLAVCLLYLLSYAVWVAPNEPRTKKTSYTYNHSVSLY
ncbi:MAG: hypothetical protein PUB42_00105 [Firmicutes bacterium]|nr:hypothetical protein [Bacillota bacterium]